MSCDFFFGFTILAPFVVPLWGLSLTMVYICKGLSKLFNYQYKVSNFQNGQETSEQVEKKYLRRIEAFFGICSGLLIASSLLLGPVTIIPAMCCMLLANIASMGQRLLLLKKSLKNPNSKPKGVNADLNSWQRKLYLTRKIGLFIKSLGSVAGIILGSAFLVGLFLHPFSFGAITALAFAVTSIVALARFASFVAAVKLDRELYPFLERKNWFNRSIDSLIDFANRTDHEYSIGRQIEIFLNRCLYGVIDFFMENNRQKNRQQVEVVSAKESVDDRLHYPQVITKKEKKQQETRQAFEKLAKNNRHIIFTSSYVSKLCDAANDGNKAANNLYYEYIKHHVNEKWDKDIDIDEIRNIKLNRIVD